VTWLGDTTGDDENTVPSGHSDGTVTLTLPIAVPAALLPVVELALNP
jgi:hypothetical protein